MFDINFIMKMAELDEITFDSLESCRSKQPFVFNIETTNNCNMKCPFCARTTKMTRKVETMSDRTFERAIEELKPHSDSLWQKWKAYVEKAYGISENDMDQNHFYVYISSRCVTLHGFGEPILDKGIAGRVQLLTDKQIPTYFSMNPANIDLKQLEDVLEAGLSYLKFSIDSIYDIKSVRGKQAGFETKKLYEALNLRKRGFDTKMILTMIQLSERQTTECRQFLYMFKDIADYVYVKSQDNRWLFQHNDVPKQKSIHWTDPCKMPWSSMTVLSGGQVVPCHQMYNDDLVLGNVNYEGLSSIWNSQKYNSFRKAHFELNHPWVVKKCVEECDMKLMGEQ